VSLLFGIARGDGLLLDLDQPVTDFFPEYETAHPGLARDPVRAIRLRHILSMSSGWHWDEYTYPYSDPRNSEIAMDIAADPTLYVLTQEIVSPPGSVWTYSGGDVALVGIIISKATGQPLEEFAKERLFDPMGIRFEWSKNRDIPRAASGLRLTPRDMAKIGQLVLDHGMWNGRQLVPADWIQLATTPRIDNSAKTMPGMEYGYLWWLPNHGDIILGTGNGGQRIWIVPALDLLVITTAGAYNRPDQGEAPRAILEAVTNAARAGD